MHNVGILFIGVLKMQGVLVLSYWNEGKRDWVMV